VCQPRPQYEEPNALRHVHIVRVWGAGMRRRAARPGSRRPAGRSPPQIPGHYRQATLPGPSPSLVTRAARAQLDLQYDGLIAEPQQPHVFWQTGIRYDLDGSLHWEWSQYVTMSLHVEGVGAGDGGDGIEPWTQA